MVIDGIPIIELPQMIELRDYQKEAYNAIFVLLYKKAFLDWHRRCGKEVAFLNICICIMMMWKGNYHYMFPKLGQARRAIFQGITKDGIHYTDFFPKEFIKSFNKADNYIELKNGSILNLVGTDDYDKYRGGSSNGIFGSELAFQNPLAMKVFRAMINETNGYWLVNTTPNGHGHAWRLRNAAIESPDWFVSILSVTDTRKYNIISDQQILEDKLEMSNEEIRTEYWNDWDTSFKGAYFAPHLQKAEREGRVTDIPISTGIPVYTFWDIATGNAKGSDSTSITFVQIEDSGYINLIGYYQQDRVGLEEHAAFIDKFRDDHNIRYAYHILPHDGKNGTLDRENGATRLAQVKRKLGTDNVLTTNVPPSIMDKINLTRTQFSNYRIHKTNCEFLIDCIKQYQPKILKSGQEVGPLKDWSSHGVDSLMLIALAYAQELIHASGIAYKVYNNDQEEDEYI